MDEGFNCVFAESLGTRLDFGFFNPFASEKIRTDSRIREIQVLTPFN